MVVGRHWLDRLLQVLEIYEAHCGILLWVLPLMREKISCRGEPMNIPYIPQIGEGANLHHNDCGPACASMLIAAYKDIILSPDEYYETMNVQGDPYQAVWQLKQYMALFDLPASWFVNLDMETLRDVIYNRQPPIALVQYAPLSNAKCTQFHGSFQHFVVVTGIDAEYVYMHDPYRTDGQGDIPVPYYAWWDAWTKAVPYRGLLVPDYPLPDPVWFVTGSREPHKPI